MPECMFRRHLPALAAATLVVIAFAGVQPGLGADGTGTGDAAGTWTSSLKTGDVVARGTVWKVTVTPTPDSVDFWASGRVIGTDRSAPFEVPLDIPAGDHKIGFCHRKDGEQKCETTEPGTGIVARITVKEASATSPAPPTTPAPTTPTPTTPTPTTSTPTTPTPTTPTPTTPTTPTPDDSFALDSPDLFGAHRRLSRRSRWRDRSRRRKAVFRPCSVVGGVGQRGCGRLRRLPRRQVGVPTPDTRYTFGASSVARAISSASTRSTLRATVRRRRRRRCPPRPVRTARPRPFRRGSGSPLRRVRP